jgi:drug/metabolite transporter (DMT)-like permease
MGLNWTYASVFQMMRGAVVVFVAILTVLILKQKLYPVHWVGVMGTVMGLLLVGLSSVLGPHDSANASNPILGDVLVVAAQLITAFQMVLEQKYLDKYKVPALQVVRSHFFARFMFVHVMFGLFVALFAHFGEWVGR